VTVADAAPAWFLEPVDGYVAELAAVGLTDPTGAISQETLDRWMESARASSEHARHAARSRWDNAAAVPQSARAMQIDREIDRERESKGYKTRSSRARGAAPQGAPRAFGEIMTEMGLDPKVAKREASS